MIYRNICPICGNENPEGSQFCLVCKADLQTLPDEFFTNEHTTGGSQANPETKPKSVDEQEFDPNRAIPRWLIDRFNNKEKQGQNPEKMDFDSYTNIMFGVPPLENSASPEKVLTPKKPEKREKTVFQPSLESTVEAPLVEEDENQKTVSPDYPALYDFKTVRPVKKWNDPTSDSRYDTVKAQTEKEFAKVSDIPALWLEDAPLVEEGENISKGADDYNSEFANSVSPTKVIGSEETSGMAQNAEFAAAAVTNGPEDVHEDADEFKPESGSLLSDLMNEINSNAGMPAPAETNDQGTVFFTGNGDRNTAGEAAPESSDITPDTENAGGSAAVLDQILRRIGYSVEGGSGDSPAEGSSDSKSGPDLSASKESGKEPDPALIIESDEEPGEKQASGMGFDKDAALGLELDPPLIESNDTEDPAAKNASDEYDPDEDPDDTEIPWDLFGSADMSLPQASDEPGYRTFSRTGIPEEDSKAETYQQRMLSSVLGKIIHAENFVPPEKKINARAISFWSRIFWSFLAIAGVVLILTSEISNKVPLSAASQSENDAAFWKAAEEIRGDALAVIDYTPSYG
ncbi:MAG: zinc ribbon domain-containing protein, partial [Lachnospiraceae bacterium]|nr:zinc ribbon domain-containing protein [Lachnospiraceae bacterium]